MQEREKGRAAAKTAQPPIELELNSFYEDRPGFRRKVVSTKPYDKDDYDVVQVRELTIGHSDTVTHIDIHHHMDTHEKFEVLKARGRCWAFLQKLDSNEMTQYRLAQYGKLEAKPGQKHGFRVEKGDCLVLRVTVFTKRATSTDDLYIDEQAKNRRLSALAAKRRNRKRKK